MGRTFRRKLRSDSGFTLIELVAAMTVFSLAAGAVLSVLVAGIRTAGFSRDRTLGKDLARQHIEEMRRLPFFLSYGSFPRAVDALDYYFPNMQAGCPNLSGASATSPGYNATTKKFTCVINSLPQYPRFGLTIISEFVDSFSSGIMVTVDPATPNPIAGYLWNDPSNDLPPSKFVRVVVRSSWTVGGRPQSFQIESLLGETKPEFLATQGTVTGNIFSAGSAFSDNTTLAVEVGVLSTSILRGNSTIARNDGVVASAKAVTPDGFSTQILGAQFVAIAPADITQGAKISQAKSDLKHPVFGFLTVASIGLSAVESSYAKVIATPPAAQGKSTLQDTGADLTVGISSKNEVTPGYKYLDDAKDYFRIIKVSGKNPVITFPNCTESSAPKTVTCGSGDSRLGELRMVPVNYTSLGVPTPPGTNGSGYLFEIEFSKLQVTAKAKAQNETATSASADTLFNGLLRWFSWNGAAWETNQVCIRDFATAATSPCGTPTTLPDLTTCLVTVVGTCQARIQDYVSSWTRLVDGTKSITDGGTNVEASLNGALSITTQPTNSTYANTGYVISVGNMKAQAVDKR